MTKYNTLNVKLSNSQLNKVKSGKKNGTEVTLTIHKFQGFQKIFFQGFLKFNYIK